MTARFFASGLYVYDRKTGGAVCTGCRSAGWAEMIADGLNMVVDQVAPWSPSAAHVDVLDGEVVERPARRALPGPIDPAFDVRQRALNMDLGARVARHSDGMLR